MTRRERAIVMTATIMAVVGAVAAFAAGRATVGPRQADRATYVSPGGTRITLLLDAERLGGSEVEVGEIEFPAGADSQDHAHGATEIFYVLSGTLEHIVDGRSERLEPGMLGFVRPPATVRHRTGDEPVKALVIWAPGGEGARIVRNWRREP